MAARSTVTTSSRRRGPTGRLSEVADRRRGGRALPSSAILARIQRRPRAWRGVPGPARPARRRRPRQASAASSRPRGAGAGNPSARACAVPATRSTSVPSTASPAMPSASTWSMMTSSAVPPSASPVTNVADHSGRERGMGSASWAAARSSRARSSPGGGQHTCRMCSSISNAGSSAPVRPPASGRCPVQPLPQPRYGTDPLAEHPARLSDAEPRRGVEHYHGADVPGSSPVPGSGLHQVSSAGPVNRGSHCRFTAG